MGVFFRCFVLFFFFKQRTAYEMRISDWSSDVCSSDLAYATRFRDRPAYRYVVETSIYVAGPVQGQGTGRLLYRALIDTLRAQGFTQAISAVPLTNDHSIALHEATGFRPEGGYHQGGYKHGQRTAGGVGQIESTNCAGLTNA